MCAEKNIAFDPRPARRHKKIGSVESDNGTIWTLVKTLLFDKTHVQDTRNSYQIHFKISSKATILKNVMYGSKSRSSFELAHGYTPLSVRTPKRMLPEELLSSYHKQVFRRAFHIMLRSFLLYPDPCSRRTTRPINSPERLLATPFSQFQLSAPYCWLIRPALNHYNPAWMQTISIAP